MEFFAAGSDFLDPSNPIVLITAGGAVVVVILSLVLKAVRSLSSQKQHPDFPTDSRAANLLALGLQQSVGAGNLWNDPTASHLTQADVTHLRAQWNLESADDVRGVVTRLLTQRHRREGWQRLLRFRSELTTDGGGHAPSGRQWLAVLKDVDGAPGAADREFITAIDFYERELGRTYFPDTAPVVSLDGYALGQAIGVCALAVRAGLLSLNEANALIEQVNEVARVEFDSWEAFGRSFALGGAMHWSNGKADDRTAASARESIRAMEGALDPRRRGPWATLPWILPHA